jgi:hypothetical protein
LNIAPSPGAELVLTGDEEAFPKFAQVFEAVSKASPLRDLVGVANTWRSAEGTEQIPNPSAIESAWR